MSTRRRRQHTSILAFVLVLAAVVIWKVIWPQIQQQHQTTAPASTGYHVSIDNAKNKVDRLKVATDTPAKHEHSQFASQGSCDTRDKILARDLKDVSYKSGTCDVTSGVLTSDPYSGACDIYSKVDSQATALKDKYPKCRIKGVDIDHIVAEHDAAMHGAAHWNTDRWEEFSNDPQNLITVDLSANRSKGDGDAAEVLPQNTAFRCTYVAGQVTVKLKYQLTVDSDEKKAMEKVLDRC